MKNSEIRELSKNDLFDKIDDTKALLSKLKLNHAITPLENPNKIKETRRLIARLITELHKRNLTGE
jgi:large subunit ribosomal protein L29